jgi:IS605 OrfB family transposase
MKVNRVLKLKVELVGWRNEDIYSFYNKDKSVSHGFVSIFDDAREAANRLTSVLFALSTGALPYPKDANGKDIPLQTLRYQYFSRKYIPGNNDKGYEPRRFALQSNCLNALSMKVYKDFTSKRKDVSIGNRALDTYRSMPIYIGKEIISLLDDNNIKLTLFAKNPVIVRPTFKLTPAQQKIFDNCKNEIYKLTQSSLSYDKKKKNFYLNLGCEYEVDEKPVKTFLGIDRGIRHTLAIAMLDENGVYTPFKKEEQHFLEFPASAVSSINQITDEVSRLQKYRAPEHKDINIGKRLNKLRNKRLNTSDTVSKQLAASVVNFAIRNNSGIYLEDLTGIKDGIDEMSEDFKSGRASFRKKMKWVPWYKIQENIRFMALKNGIPVHLVDPRNTSKTCSSCGLIWSDKFKKDLKKDGRGFGRINESFKCTCGAEEHADINAAINIAKKGFNGDTLKK